MISAGVLVVLGAFLPQLRHDDPEVVRGAQLLGAPTTAAHAVAPVPTPAPSAARTAPPTSVVLRPTDTAPTSAPASTAARTGPLPGTATAAANPVPGVRPVNRVCRGNRVPRSRGT
jgi:hypothetical protein